MAEQIERGDLIVFYVTRVQAFGGIVRVVGEMYEDRTKVWPSLGVSPPGSRPRKKPGKVDPYPWRFETEPVAVLDEDDFVPAIELVDELEHVSKWPAEHWHLAFQGQLQEGLGQRRPAAGGARGRRLHSLTGDPRPPLQRRRG